MDKVELMKDFVPGKTYIPASYPLIGSHERELVEYVLDRDWETNL